MRDEFLDPEATIEVDRVDDVSLRPRRLDEFVGLGDPGAPVPFDAEDPR